MATWNLVRQLGNWEATENVLKLLKVKDEKTETSRAQLPLHHCLETVLEALTLTLLACSVHRQEEILQAEYHRNLLSACRSEY